jgi:hypothetical protein
MTSQWRGNATSAAATSPAGATQSQRSGFIEVVMVAVVVWLLSMTLSPEHLPSGNQKRVTIGFV